MDKYRAGLDKKFKPEGKRLPINEGQQALVRAEFTSRERESFFNEAYSDILADVFVKWLNTNHHEKETREYLYATAMALGSVKEKLIQIDTFGKNIPYIQKHTPDYLKREDTDDAA